MDSVRIETGHGSSGGSVGLKSLGGY